MNKAQPNTAKIYIADLSIITLHRNGEHPLIETYRDRLLSSHSEVYPFWQGQSLLFREWDIQFEGHYALCHQLI